MRVYLNWRRLPEVKWLSFECQQRVWKSAQRDVGRSVPWKVFVPGLAWALSALLLVWWLERIGQIDSGLGTAAFFYVFLFGPILLGLTTIHMIIARARPHLRRRVELEFGQPLCWECEYDLKGNESGTCPECGATLSSCVGVAETIQ